MRPDDDDLLDECRTFEEEYPEPEEEGFLCEAEGGTGPCRMMNCKEWGGDGICFLALGRSARGWKR